MGLPLPLGPLPAPGALSCKLVRPASGHGAGGHGIVVCDAHAVRKPARFAQDAYRMACLDAVQRANMRSILVAMMKSFSCSPLIFLVCSETVALPQPKLIFG